MIDTLIVILIVVVVAHLSYTISKGIDNNNMELFQGFFQENERLKSEKDYWKNLYCELHQSIDNEDLEELLDSRGNVKAVYKSYKRIKEMDRNRQVKPDCKCDYQGINKKEVLCYDTTSEKEV